jgi:hypothetical protein
MTADREKRITAEVTRQGPRLRNFVRRRVAAPDARGHPQDVFFASSRPIALSRSRVDAW